MNKINKEASCDLCKLVFDHEIKTKLYFENASYIVVDCLTCKIPMLVLKDHVDEFTREQEVELTIILKNLFKGLRKLIPTQFIDYDMRLISNHAHVHVRSIE